jgi:hypothetical protein
MGNNNNLDYQNIRGIKDLKYHRKMLSSRIDHQEIMISYLLRTMKDSYSPLNLAYMGFESLASRNSGISVVFKAFNAVRAFILGLRR